MNILAYVTCWHRWSNCVTVKKLSSSIGTVSYNKVYPEYQASDRGKIPVSGSHRRRSLLGQLRTSEQPGEGCDEQHFTKFRYRNLII